MKKTMHRRLQLKTETLQRLNVLGGVIPTDRCAISETCADTCSATLPVPSVDNCGTGALACASQNPPGCYSGAGCF